jgi:quinoprotein glucose dehydrogenase
MGNTLGGTNWPGGSLDPETHIVYVQACNACINATSVAPVPPEEGDATYTGGRVDTSTGDDGPRGGLAVQGLPIVKPPYGVLSAIDLDTGELLWQVPHGDTPDDVRDDPALEGIDVPKTGQARSVGLVVTKTLVILGDPEVTSPPGREPGAMLRAYDKETGEEVGAVWLPAPQSGSPMTYMVDGKQYIVVAVSGRRYTGEYIAFALPDA